MGAMSTRLIVEDNFAVTKHAHTFQRFRQRLRFRNHCIVGKPTLDGARFHSQQTTDPPVGRSFVLRREDVAEAIARAMQTTQSRMYYELGGPRMYTYKLLLEVIARHLGIKPLLVPMPFALWQALAYAAEMLPQPPITRNQVELMQTDSVASPGAPKFDDLRI
jgi:nucleoside-diphosphate-sugar epimerase